MERRLLNLDGYTAQDARTAALQHIDAYRRGRARQTPTGQHDSALAEELRAIRERSTEQIRPICGSCGDGIVSAAMTRVGPPASGPFSATYTEWAHADGRGVWCDGNSHRYARATVRPGNPDALRLLEEIARLTTHLPGGGPAALAGEDPTQAPPT